MLEQAKKLLSDHKDVISTLQNGKRGSETGPNAKMIAEDSERVESFRYSPRELSVFSILTSYTSIKSRLSYPATQLTLVSTSIIV